MKTIKLYQVNCNLLFNNDEEIVDFAPNFENSFTFQPSLQKAIEIYDGINKSDFDKKTIMKAKLKGFGSTYTKYILVVEMPLKLYKECGFEDNNELCTPEQFNIYLNEMVWHESVNWKLPNIKDCVFDINWHTMEFSEFRDYELKTA
jgi:hypothetical protein